MNRTVRESRKEIGEAHLFMVVEQLGNQMQTMDTQDPSTTMDNLDHDLDIFEKQVRIWRNVADIDTIS